MSSVNDFRQIKNYVVQRFGYDDDFSNSFDFFDSMITHLVAGDLDDVLFSNLFVSLPETEAKRTLSLAHQYQKLCFYDGDSSNWLDSIEGNAMASDELVVFRIFQNFSFLVQMCQEGGEPLLEQLSKFEDCNGFSDCSVIEYLRGTFGNDTLLKDTLLFMSNNHSLYSIFTDSQKAQLLTFPQGTVYFYGKDGYQFTHPLLLSMEIYNRMNQTTLLPYSGVVDNINQITMELKDYFQEDVNFSDVVQEMSNDYCEAIRKISGRPASNVFELWRDMQGVVPKTGWTIDDNPLSQMLETPYQPISCSNHEIGKR